ncbi:4-Cys prefix domain-containing protein [Halomicronema hongdechloris]|uniref:4-Cys prefix domain-containing protein n=1 Tax=Halomicronema hongdechloris TaxID=1209493 RepID=UPI003704B24F
MSLCINPRCPQPDHPDNGHNRYCQGCGSELVLQGAIGCCGCSAVTVASAWSTKPTSAAPR